MALINRAGQEISAKVVYYGPGLSGKTTNLEVLFRQVPEDNRGKMISMKTRTDRTLFFDLLPLSGDAILDFNVRILLYTVPGQVYYNATRRLVLKGVDAVVFVADSQRGKMEENLESLENLRSNLVDMGLKLEDLPWVIQYNKRDLPDILSVEELEQALNPTGVPSFTAVAPRGEGVQETLRGVTEHLRPQLQRMVEKELGDTLRSGHGAAPSPMQSTPPRSVQQSTPPAPVPPPAPAAPDGGARHTLDLGGLPDPRVVEMAPGTHPKPQSPAAGGIADLMDGRDMRRALREVETSVEASPLRSLSETPAPSTHNAQSPLERMTASTPTAKTPSHVVPEIVEIQEMPTPTPPVTQTPYTAAPVNAAPPVAPPPAPPAPEPPQAVAPPAPTPVAPPATPPAAVTDSAPQVLTLRVPRSLLIRGEITLRLVLDDSPSATGGGQSGAASSAATPAAPAAPAAPAPTAAPVASAEPVTAAPPPPPPAPAPAPAPEPVPVPAAAPAHARSSAPMAGRPAGTGTRFALRDGELVPLD